MVDLEFTIEVERRNRPGRKAWRAAVLGAGFITYGDPHYGRKWYYGRTEAKAVAKAQRWIDKRNRTAYRAKPTV